MNKKIYFLQFFFWFFIITSCTSKEENLTSDPTNGGDTNENPTVNYADIDFSNWKVTLPVDENNNGSPDEYQPSVLVNNATYSTETTIENLTDKE